MRTFTCVSVLVGALGTCTTARAHHGVFTPAPVREQPNATTSTSELRVDASTTAFRIDDQQGQFWTVALTSQVRLDPTFALSLRVPVHRLIRDGRDPVTGLGDVRAGASTRLASRERWLLDLGLDVALPTGDAARGLGQGTAALLPFTRTAFAARPSLYLVAGVAGAVNTRARGAFTTTVIEHRADVELGALAGVVWERPRVRVSTFAQARAPLAPASVRGRVYVTAAPSLACRIVGGFWLELSSEVPLSRSTRQLDWRAGLALAYHWGAAAPTRAPSAPAPDR